MPELQPFAGWYYEPWAVDPAACLAPPYDQVDAATYRRLITRCPYNVVRVDLPLDRFDVASPDPYRRAADVLRRWLHEGILRHFPAPAFYWYVHTFPTPEGRTLQRSGLIALVRCVPPGLPAILPHEEIHEGPVSDRVHHLQATGLQTSPIFFVYRPTQTTQALAADLEAQRQDQKPFLRVEAPDGEIHEVWVVDAPEAVVRVQSAFAEVPLLIADGHHRYEALRRVAALRPDEPAWGYALGYLADADQPGLLQTGYHRLLTLRRPIDRAALMAGLKRYFDLEGEGRPDAWDTIRSWAESDPADPHLWMLYGRPPLLYRWRLKPEFRGHLGDPDTALDAQVVQRFVFEAVLAGHLGLTPSDYDVHYLPWLPPILRALHSGSAQLAFLLHPIPVATLFRLAVRGLRVPPKSTYFYPKVPAGLWMHIVPGPVYNGT